jgi:catechol 2,3-dioxygenase-like lactoylglutathione lyase family enzyme
MAKLRHIAIRTEDPEQTAAWYKEAFGLEEVGRARNGVYLTDGDVNIAILRTSTETTRR